MRIRTFCGAAALAILFTVSAGASEFDRLTHFTFRQPVRLPGVTLAAGTYTFKLADPHVVQVFNEADSSLVATIMTHPAPAPASESPKDPVVTFIEQPAGTPRAIKAWFYPGSSIGEEFLYLEPKPEAFAEAAHLSAASSPQESRSPIARPSDEVNGAAESSDRTTAFKPDAVARPRTNAAAARSAAQVAPNQQPAPGASQSSQAPPASSDPKTPTTLPRTASPLALMALLSGLSLAGGLGLRQVRKRR